MTADIADNWLDKINKFFSKEPEDKQQLLELLLLAKQRNILDNDGLAMMEGVLQVSEMRAGEIMIPRSQMTAIPKDKPFEEILQSIVESSHSRFPVFNEDVNEIIGILLAKDLLAHCTHNRNTNIVFDIEDLIRPAIFIPESKRLDVLLRDFRLNRHHMAMVVDEYGAVSGLVTIEDVLEQIVGDIEDENDFSDHSFIIQKDKNYYILKALMPIEEFNKYFDTSYSNQDYDTIAGMAMNILGHLPKRGEHFHIDNFYFEITKADNRRVHLIKLSITK